MKQIILRFAAALLTFLIGASAVYLLIFKTHFTAATKSLIHSPGAAIIPNTKPAQFHSIKRSTKGIYKNPSIFDGLYDGDKEHSLVLSFNDRPIPPKSNDPDAPTIPGFYPFGEHQRFNFERVEVISNKVYFKTCVVNNISYEFTGKTGKEFDDYFDAYIPFIKGAIIKLKNRTPIKKTKITFGHAVVY